MSLRTGGDGGQMSRHAPGGLAVRASRRYGSVRRMANIRRLFYLLRGGKNKELYRVNTFRR
jgi:hypothetical protein